MQSVSAVTVTAESSLPYECSNISDFTPVEEMIVVDLLRVYKGASTGASDISKEIFYEFTYVNTQRRSPFHAISINGDVFFHQCDIADISSKMTINGKPVIVVGATGTIPSSMQPLIEKYNITTFSAAVARVVDGNLALEEKTECGNICEQLQPAKGNWQTREYKLEIERLTAVDVVDQKDTITVSAFIKNIGEYGVYGDTAAPVYVSVPAGSAFYDSSWISSDNIQKNTGALKPGEQTEIKFTLNTPLVPGKYEQIFELKVGDKVVKDSAKKISFSVSNNNLALAIIRPKDNIPFARVRSSASLNASELFKLDPDTVVIILNDQGAWLEIQTKQGNKGWMYRPNLKFIN
jgi:hypothetical protein